MLLSETEETKNYKITNLKVDNVELKRRLYSFGVSKNQIIEVLKTSMSKSNIEIEVNGTAIALRLEEAKQIEVEEI